MIAWPTVRPYPLPEEARWTIATFLEQHDCGSSDILRALLASLEEGAPFELSRLGRLEERLAAAAVSVIAGTYDVTPQEMPVRADVSLAGVATFAIRNRRSASGRAARDLLLSLFNGAVAVDLSLGGRLPAEERPHFVNVLRAMFVPPLTCRLYDEHIRRAFVQRGAEDFFFRPLNSK